MIMRRPYRPSRWTLVACYVAAIALPAWWVGLHPGIWGGREFEGMVQTLVLLTFSMACAPVVLILAVVGMIRKDPLAFVVLVVTSGLAWYFFTLRDTSVIK